MRDGWLRAWTGGRRAIHLGNVGEFQAQFEGRFRGAFPAPTSSDHYACMSAFASSHPAVLVLPLAVPREWVEMVGRALAWEPVEVFDGLGDPAGVGAAVLARPALAAHLRELRAGGLPLVPWGRTRAIAELAGEPFAPSALRYESKRAANELFTRLAPGHPMIAVPEQWPVSSRWAAARALRGRARLGLTTVVKTEHGAGGSGTRLVDGDRFRLPRGPLLLEEYVAGTGSPRDLTYDGVVGADGEVHDVGVAVMDVAGTAYQGATLGPGVVPGPLAEAALPFGRAVGREVAASGYRGWFDVDFVADRHRRLAPTEINLRLTGPAAAFMVKARLDAIRGGDHVVRTIDAVALGGRLPGNALIALMRRLALRCAHAGATLVPSIPTAAFAPHPFVGVVLAAHTVRQLDTAESEVRHGALSLGRRFRTMGSPAGSRGSPR